jgi:ABC-2 type transport system ATP-binding protein
MPVIEVSGLRKQYGSKVAVEDVSFTVEAGEIFGILGPNGAGKTTTVECVTGLRAPDRGVLRVLGRNPRRDHDELDALVGVQLQDSQLPDKIRVSEAIDLYASFYRRPARSGELLTRLGLADQRNAFFSKLSGGRLTGGWKRRWRRIPGCTLNCSARPGKRVCLRNGSEWPGRFTTPWPRA